MREVVNEPSGWTTGVWSHDGRQARRPVRLAGLAGPPRSSYCKGDRRLGHLDLEARAGEVGIATGSPRIADRPFPTGGASVRDEREREEA